MTEALIGFGAIFVLALLRVPLAFAMGFVGFVGLGLMRGWAPTAATRRRWSTRPASPTR